MTSSNARFKNGALTVPEARSSTRAASLAAVLAVLLAATPAWADFWGGDLPLLTGIFASVADGIAKASETLSTLRKTYDETKRVVGFAEDAADAYQRFSQYNSKMFAADVTATFDSAFPDLAYLRRESSRTGPWTQATGELQRLLLLCLTGPKGSCEQVQEVMTYQDTRNALAKTFGAAPVNAYSMLAVDHEAAQAIRAGQSQTGRSARERGMSATWMKSCEDSDSSDKDNLAACQAAAGSAQIESLRATADVADQVAEGNRLSALQLEQRNEDRKRDLLEATERHQVLLDGLHELPAAPARVHADGFNLFQEDSQ